jgi:hypothetical protein
MDYEKLKKNTKIFTKKLRKASQFVAQRARSESVRDFFLSSKAAMKCRIASRLSRKERLYYFESNKIKKKTVIIIRIK